MLASAATFAVAVLVYLVFRRIEAGGIHEASEDADGAGSVADLLPDQPKTASPTRLAVVPDNPVLQALTMKQVGSDASAQTGATEADEGLAAAAQ